MIDFRKVVMLEELYNAADYSFILENFDTKTLLRKYSFTGGKILLDAIRNKCDKLSFLRALGNKIDDFEIVVYLEKVGYHFVVNSSPLFNKYTREKVSQLFGQDDFYFEEEDQSLMDTVYTLYGRNDNYDVLLFLEKAFYESLQADKEVARRDISHLIEMKRRYHDFDIVFNAKKGSSFCKDSGDLGKIELKDANVLAFNHEFVHALQRFRRNRAVVYPKYDESKKDELIQNLYTIAKQNALSEDFAKRKFDEYIAQSGGLEEYKRKLEIDFQKKFGTEDLVRNVLSSPKRTKELLDYVYDAYVSKKKYKGTIDDNECMVNYISFDMAVEYELFKRKLYEVMYGEFLIFQNFVDAYMYGSLYDYYIKHTYHKGVYSVCVHTQNYFVNNPDARFSEMLADYAALKKSVKGHVFIDYLRTIIGNEFVDSLDEYYMNLDDYNFDENFNARRVI